MTIHQTTFEADKTATQTISLDKTTSSTTLVGVLKAAATRCSRMFWSYTEAQEKSDTSSYDGLV